MQKGLFDPKDMYEIIKTKQTIVAINIRFVFFETEISIIDCGKSVIDKRQNT